MNKTEWILCPICGNKTRTMIREDMFNFKKVDDNRFKINHLHPRHGSVLHITEEEYCKLKKHFNN